LLDIQIRFGMGRVYENADYIFAQQDQNRRMRRDPLATAARSWTEKTAGIRVRNLDAECPD
jgi:hypothetical protein